MKEIVRKSYQEIKKVGPRFDHQKLVQVEFLVEILNKKKEVLVEKGSKHYVGLKDAEKFVADKRAKIVA